METLDPILVKAIRLLHSSSKSSTEQLKSMLEDALAQKQISLKAPTKPVDQPKVKTESWKPAIEKRPFEKSKAESIDVPIVEKRMKLAPETSMSSIRCRSLSSSPDPCSKPLVLPAKSVETSAAVKVEPQSEDSEATDIDDDVDEGESFALDCSEFGDLACVVCRSMDYKPGNQLVECQECHSLYHQSCHKPPATDPEVLDPRSIWNCNKCMKSMKKSSNKLSAKSSASALSSPHKPLSTFSSDFQTAVNFGKECGLQLVKERSLKQQQSQHQAVQSPEPSVAATPALNQASQPFRRCEPSKAGSSGGMVTSKPIGLAGLAANLNSKSSASIGSNSGSGVNISSSSGCTGSAGVQIGASASSAVADKRLQLMRKKAAKTANEKKRSK